MQMVMGLRLILERLPIGYAATTYIIASTFICYAEGNTHGEKDKGSRCLRVLTYGSDKW